MRLKLVIGQILGRVANGPIDLPQFCIQRELHKERFDELARVMDLKRLEIYRLAFTRGF